MAVNEIRYKGVSYATDDDIKVPSGILYEVKALRSDSLEANSLTVTVFSNNKAIMGFAKNDKVEYFRDGRRVGVYYLQTVERVGSDAYTLSALSALGRLITMRHVGGIYTGQTVAEVVPQICAPVAVMIESVYASRQLYGYLPYSNPDKEKGNGRSARDNLSQVLFAIGASLGVDENGVMRVEKLWDGVSATITADQINENSCSTVYETPVSAVEITEHQWVKSQDTVTLFEGTAEDGALVTFEEPAHSLTAEGFTITEQGDNYAILSAGTGTLTGKSYNHLTRIVRRTVTEGAEENVVTVSDATLVSLTNSVDVAKRMADYYRHRETIRVDVEPGTERAGRVVQIFHPWDKKMVQACVESRETVISGILNSQTSALVGFKPAQPEAAEYLDERVVLTGSGEFQIPEGTTTIHYVMISAGQGGRCGEKGEDTQSGPKFSWTNPVFEDRVDGYALALGGKGGPGGKGGMGGRIVEGDLDVAQLKSLAYDCGKSGKGAEYSPDDLPGTDGTDTVFHGMTTAGASAPDWGFTDPITGEQFGGVGEDGLPGGDGAGRDPSVSEYTDDSVQKYVNGTIAYDEDGNAFTPGPVAGSEGKVSMTRIASTSTPRSFGWYSSGLGGGPAAGANGKAGSSGRGLPGVTTVNVTGGPGADGMTATLTPSKPRRYGRGGRGGYGGGGAGSGGIAVKNGNGTITPGTPGSGGLGGPGGPSADGCVILYYRKFGQAKAGPLVQRGGGLFFDRLNKLFIV
jgi:hypothetical protein